MAAQESQLAQVAATLPPLLKQLAQQRDLLAVLAGRFPNAAPTQDFSLSSLQLPQDLPVSLPSQLVAQRPDVLQAEANLHDASAKIGIATANRLPNIVLPANAGSTAAAMDQLFSSGTGFWGLGAELTAPLFQGGTLLHQERAAKAAYVEAAEQYRSAVPTSLSERCRRYADGARTGCGRLKGRRCCRGCGQSDTGSRTPAVARRLRRLPRTVERRTVLSTKPDKPGAGPGESLRRHGSVVSGARWRLVAPRGFNEKLSMKNKLSAACVLMVAITALSSCTANVDSAPQPASVTPGNATLTAAQRQNIHLYTVEPSAYNKAIDAAAVVDFDNDQATGVLAPFSGPVARILVSPGDRVKKGDPLAAVSSPDFATAVSVLIARRSPPPGPTVGSPTWIRISSSTRALPSARRRKRKPTPSTRRPTAMPP